GFVISSDGYIVTNYHVIEGASTIKVTFYDGTEYSATLVGGEQSNDVAVLKINASGLTPVIIGDSDAMNVGQAVTAIGNPLGELTFSQTAGIISAKDRTVTLSGGTKINMLQTDCTINSGNSGGPLFNSYGEVIGITSAKYSNNGSYSEATIEGIGFAIPINDVIDIIQDLIEHGYVTGKPSVGIIQTNVTTEVQRYGIPAGAEVLAVLEGSCAEKGGLQEGDIITAVGETTVTGSSDLQTAIKNYRAGEKVTFTVYRNGESVELQLTLDEYNQERSDAMDALYEEYNQSQQQTQQNSNGSSGGGFSFNWPFGW
ncbi:MAG: S1C family serine protease, partial [Oscillospiraceae bacterium]